MVAGFLRVVGQLFLQFGDAGFDFLAVGAVFVHFHWRKHGLRVIRQMAGGLIHFLLGQMRRADADVAGIGNGAAGVSDGFRVGLKIREALKINLLRTGLRGTGLFADAE